MTLGNIPTGMRKKKICRVPIAFLPCLLPSDLADYCKELDGPFANTLLLQRCLSVIFKQMRAHLKDGCFELHLPDGSTELIYPVLMAYCGDLIELLSLARHYYVNFYSLARPCLKCDLPRGELTACVGKHVSSSSLRRFC